MGKTLAEKILSEKSGVDAKAGNIVVADVDVTLGQDITAPIAIEQFKACGFKSLVRPESCVIFPCHNAPAINQERSNSCIMVSSFAKEMGAQLWDAGSGTCHEVLNEYYVSPGDVVVGADSHTTMAGGLGAFGAGVGSTETAIIMALGQTWFRVPQSIKVWLNGSFQKGVYAKDLALHLCGIFGSNGANYKSLEFSGAALTGMTISDRLTIANMGVDMGAKTAIFPSDDTTREYLEAQGRGQKYRPLEADDDAQYERVIEIDITEIEPTVSKPHLMSNIAPARELKGTRVQQVLIGTCTNGHIEDLEVAAHILKGKQRHPDTRLLIAPASRQVFSKALAAGYIQTFHEAGAMVLVPGCGPCPDGFHGALGDGEVGLYTANRNYKGRHGNPNAFVYLGSPATAAATALRGEITDPREVL